MKSIACLFVTGLLGCTPAGVPRDAEYAYRSSSGSNGRPAPGSGSQPGSGGRIGRAPLPDRPRDAQANSNALVKEHHAKLTVTASSYWGSWRPELAIDGNLARSWFSATDDTATNKAQETKPWIQVAFPIDETVRRVTVHGNREHPWEKNYSVLAVRVDLLDAEGNVLATRETDATGEHKDFDFRFAPIGKVRSVKVTVLGDEGDRNSFRDFGIGEIEIE